MLTLVGPGGVGKTRLALRLAGTVGRRFGDGVCWVELRGVRDERLVPLTVAGALGVSLVEADFTAGLARFLVDKRLLLVLDNCEHVAAGCARLLDSLLRAAPGLKALASSRHVLHVSGEQLLTVQAFPVPEQDSEVSPENVATYDSVALFVDRVRAVQPTFRLTPESCAPIAGLCRRLEGMPLALELAASWMRGMTLDQVVQRLGTRRVYGPSDEGPDGVARTLESTIRASYELCSPAEQMLWCRLSVFAGGFDLRGAESVCAGQGMPVEEVLPALAGLVEHSAVQRVQGSEAEAGWYHMLETIRSFGEGRLRSAGELRQLRLRHRDHYAGLAEEAAHAFFGPGQNEWLLRIQRELDNLRTAIAWCFGEPGQAQVGLRMATALVEYWFASSVREGYGLLLKALDRVPEPTLVRAEGLWAAAHCAMYVNEVAQGRRLLEECRDLGGQLDDVRLRARVQQVEGEALFCEGDAPGCIAVWEQSAAAFREAGDPYGEFHVLMTSSAAAFFSDDPRLEGYARKAVALAEEHAAESSKAGVLYALGNAHWRAGRADEAIRCYRESLLRWEPWMYVAGMPFAVEAMAWVVSAVRPDDLAARLLGASAAVWRRSGMRVDELPFYFERDRQAKEAVSTAIGQERYEAAFAEGACCSLEEALALATSIGKPKGGRPVASQREQEPGPLTKRESQVAELVAEGLTNKDIASRLLISQRTVESHVENILGKLGVRSRAQVAGWVASQRLTEAEPTTPTHSRLSADNGRGRAVE
ncbi:LuxR C-terminal-related transcriptional regulator [Nocardioides gansuensis]|uniref:LuxR C-terminal-related transcriptional regulator n=1 Tax=Nocardioides gansuensis TaxID=2138300 RepID=UPI001FE49FC5|nr:LuxR C-terminal-related transcriptional regulator [Nocardioides gansuensis]